jgi:hypothetical protein
VLNTYFPGAFQKLRIVSARQRDLSTCFRQGFADGNPQITCSPNDEGRLTLEINSHLKKSSMASKDA